MDTQEADGIYLYTCWEGWKGGGSLTVAFGKHVVTVVLQSAEPCEQRGENNHKKQRYSVPATDREQRERWRSARLQGGPLVSNEQEAGLSRCIDFRPNILPVI